MMPAGDASINNRVYLGSIAVFLISFAYYLKQVMPAVPLRDGAELAVSAVTLGISHPPGYPFFILIGKIFSVVEPFANAAYKLNLMSALLLSLSIFVFVLIIYYLLDSMIPALACVPFIWMFPAVTAQGVQAEIFSGNILFLCVLILFIILNLRRPDDKIMYLSFFVSGIAAAQHQTIVFLAPVLVIAFWRQMKKRSIPLLGIFIFLGFSINLYLIVRANNSPLLNWGDPSSTGNFLRTMLRAGYGTLKLHPEQTQGVFSLNSYFGHISVFFLSFVKHTFFLALIFVPLGIVLNYKTDRRFFWCLMASFLLYVPFFLALANMPVNDWTKAMFERFFLPGIFILFIWFACGVKLLIEKAECLNIKWLDCAVLVLSLVSGVFAVMPVFAKGYSKRDFIMADFGMNLLKTVKPDSFIFTMNDSDRNVLWYIHMVENRRMDVRHLLLPPADWEIKSANMLWGELNIPYFWYGDSGFDSLIEQRKGSRIYVDNQDSETLHKYKERLVPAELGFCFDKYVISKNIHNFFVFRSPPYMCFYEDFYFRDLVSEYAENFNHQGYLLTKKGNYPLAEFKLKESLRYCPDNGQTWDLLGINAAKQEKYRLAVRYYKTAAGLSPDSADIHYNMALSYFRLADYDNSRKSTVRSLELDPAMAKSYILMGNIAYMEKDFYSALVCYNRALELDSNSYEAKKNVDIIKTLENFKKNN